MSVIRVGTDRNDYQEIDVIHRPDEKRCSINSHLLPAKITYFINCARYAINEYLILFYVSIGFTSGQSGSITALQLLGGTIAAPLWCLLADQKRNHRRLFTILCACAVLTMSMQPILNIGLGRSKRNVCPYTKHLNVSVATTHKPSTDMDDNPTLLYLLLVCSVFMSIFDGSLTSFVDCGTIQRMHTSRQQCQYGRQRIYGAFGYASGAIFYSVSIKYFPTADTSCYSGIFITYGVLGACLTLSCNWLFREISIQNKTEDVKHLVIRHLKDVDILFFLACVLCAGVSQGIWYAFIFLYMKELDAPTLLLGFSLPMTCLTASLIFFFSSKIIDFCNGPLAAMALSFFAWSARFLVLAYINDPYMVILIDLLHGFTFSLFRSASLEYIKVQSSPLISATMCGINNTMNTLGIMLANLVGGYVHDKFGSRVLFRSFSLTSFLCCVAILGKNFCRSTKYGSRLDTIK